MLLCNDFSLLSKLQANGEYRSPDKGLKTSVFPTAKKWKVGKVQKRARHRIFSKI